MKAEFNESQKSRKIFILGATGFIGFAVTLRLIDLGFKNIYCMYRDEKKKDQLFSGLNTSSITFLHGDVSQMEVLKQGLENADIVLTLLERPPIGALNAKYGRSTSRLRKLWLE